MNSVWLMWLEEGLIHSKSWTHIVWAVPPGSIITPHSNSFRSSKAPVETLSMACRLPEAWATGYLLYRLDTTWQQRRKCACVCVCVGVGCHFRKCPCAHPRIAWCPQWSQTLLSAGACLCRSMHIGAVKRLCGCVQEHVQMAIPHFDEI